MHLVLKFWLWGRFVAEKQTYVLNLMAGHLLNMTYNENGKLNVWELDHYADRSSLGIHFWDLCWKMVYLKFENFWYSNVRPWETVQIWGDCPWCAAFVPSLIWKPISHYFYLFSYLLSFASSDWSLVIRVWFELNNLQFKNFSWTFLMPWHKLRVMGYAAITRIE